MKHSKNVLEKYKCDGLFGKLFCLVEQGWQTDFNLRTNCVQLIARGCLQGCTGKGCESRSTPREKVQ
jgi:hypothetical protein